MADKKTSPEQFAIYRGMTGQDRLEMANQIYWATRKQVTADVRARNPGWSEETVNADVNRILSEMSK